MSQSLAARLHAVRKGLSVGNNPVVALSIAYSVVHRVD